VGFTGAGKSRGILMRDHSSCISQQELLLATKLYIPPVYPRLVSRPPLTEQMNEGLSCKLTLLSAPAGSWQNNSFERVAATAAGSRLPVSWVSLDEGGNDPVRFWSYITATLEMVHPELVKLFYLCSIHHSHQSTIPKTLLIM
jgi:ATP/maltotriose-dependent transcriptional regulator MalT